VTDLPRVLVVLGTRPEAIKLAPVVNALRVRSAELQVRVCVTGQHREMLDPVLALFGIVPDHDLHLMRPDQTLASLTGAVIEGVAGVLGSEPADWVIVQGDTTTALGAGLAAFYAGARVAHVEAGLRTADKHSPFPEEANRRIVDVLSDLHFAPTERARENLLGEATDPRTVHVTGNTVIDALRYVARRHYDFTTGPLTGIPFERRIVLVTAHRRESFGGGLIAICAALRQLADEVEDIQIVYPVHLNPNVRGPAHRELSGHPRISLIPPLDYASLVQLMRRSTLILTDSGGIQEEAPTFGKPVLVMRNATERPEAVQAGCARLVGTDRARIVAEARRLLDDARAYRRMAKVTNPFGDGHASERITDLILAADAIGSGSRVRRSAIVPSYTPELSEALR
jgi:UDP-N-acetylglucosamine 2-epimerase (non-hydrolysing)